ncbi:MAG: hypothetical protein ACYTGX_06375 [Planctomycetota bacterium]|jgi:hypothetical protein
MRLRPVLLTAAFALLLLPSSGAAPWQEGKPGGDPNRPLAENERWERYVDGSVKARWYVKMREDGTEVRQGKYLEYYPDGSFKGRTECVDGAFHGKYTTYWPSGNQRVIATYHRGAFDKKYTEKNDAGEVIRTENYRRGILDGNRMVWRKGYGQTFQVWKDGTLTKLAIATPAHAMPAKDGVDPYPRTVAEIRKNLLKILDGDEGSLSDGSSRYVFYNDPARLSALRDRDKKERLAHALRRLKAYRYLVGVPYKKMTLDPQYNFYAEWGAKLCHAIGRLDHTPKNEPGWPEEEYQKGYTGTSKSNLAMGTPVEYSPDAYMDDSDAKNIDRVGHRCWCINPKMGKTGFGFEPTDKFSAMWSMDQSNKAGGKMLRVRFPSAGYYPVSFFADHYAWSLHLGKIQPKKSTPVNVYELDGDYLPTGKPLTLNYKNCKKSGMGMRGICIFRPDGITIAPGKRFWVEVDLGKQRKKDKKNLFETYFVEFCSVAPPEQAVSSPGSGK